MATGVKDIQAIATNTSQNIRQLSSSIQDESIVKWLAPADPTTDYSKAREVCHAGSGQWLLRCNEYQSWKAGKKSLIWLSGNSGRGKTVLSSTIIEDLQRASKDQAYTVLYFFFSSVDKKKQSLEDLLRSLAIQLYYDQANARPPLVSLYSACNDGTKQSSIDSLQGAFHQMLLAAGNIFVVIDALDEYKARRDRRHDLLIWIRGLCETLDNVHLLVTSRPEEDIRSAIQGWTHAEDTIPLSTDRTGRDITEYVRTEVSRSDRLARWRGHPDVQENIERVLSQKAHGVYGSCLDAVISLR